MTELSQGGPETGGLSGILAVTAARSTPCAVRVTVSDSSLTASDERHTAAASFTWEILALDVANPGTQLNNPHDAVRLQIAALDPQGGTLTYSAANLPPGLSINAATGLISGTVAPTPPAVPSPSPSPSPMARTVSPRASTGTLPPAASRLPTPVPRAVLKGTWLSCP